MIGLDQFRQGDPDEECPQGPANQSRAFCISAIHPILGEIHTRESIFALILLRNGQAKPVRDEHWKAMIWDKMHLGMSLTERDIRFLKDHFRHACRDENAFYFLLADPAALDRMLEDDGLHQHLLDSHKTLSVSPRLYFLVILKRAFRDAGLHHPELVGFLALALEERTSDSGSSADTLIAGNGFYTIDVIEQLNASGDAYRNFKLLVSVGNHLLFLTGLFPDFVKHRENRRGAPGLNYYEDFGRSTYFNAARHPVADEFDMRPICACLAEHFRDARLVLNDVAERILFLS